VTRAEAEKRIRAAAPWASIARAMSWPVNRGPRLFVAEAACDDQEGCSVAIVSCFGGTLKAAVERLESVLNGGKPLPTATDEGER